MSPGNRFLHPSRIVLSAVLAGILVFPSVARADDVLAGFDLFQTDPASTFQDFSLAPIPADFFDPGSDPFEGIIFFDGNPPGPSSLCPFDDLSQVDTIVERKQDAILPVIPSTDQIDIEIIQLELRSVSPITITYNGGLNPELWDVDVTLSPSLTSQPLGTMTITHDVPGGGVFDSELPVVPQFTFTRQSDSHVRVLDLGQPTPQSILFNAFNVPWVHWGPPLDSCTSNFCVNPDSLTIEQAALAQHGILSVCPTEPTPTHLTTWGAIKALHSGP